MITTATNIFAEVSIVIAKTIQEGGKSSYKKVGNVAIFVPTLLGLIESAVQVVTEGKPEVTEDGLPVYTEDKFNWIQNAIFTQTKAQAKNRLKPQSIELKSSTPIATDWVSLLAVAEGNRGEHLQKAREVQKLFGTFIAGLGKSPAASAKALYLFSSKDALAFSDSDVKGKMQAYVVDFVSSLEEAQTTAYATYLDNILNACSDVEAEDF